MTTAMITRSDTIKAKHPVREDFASRSTSGYDGYYETKGSAIRAYEKVLNDYGLCFNPDDMVDMPGDEGRITIDIYTNESSIWLDNANKLVGSALIMWYRMPSGRYEFTGYIA